MLLIPQHAIQSAFSPSPIVCSSETSTAPRGCNPAPSDLGRKRGPESNRRGFPLSDCTARKIQSGTRHGVRWQSPKAQQSAVQVVGRRSEPMKVVRNGVPTPGGMTSGVVRTVLVHLHGGGGAFDQRGKQCDVLDTSFKFSIQRIENDLNPVQIPPQ